MHQGHNPANNGASKPVQSSIGKSPQPHPVVPAQETSGTSAVPEVASRPEAGKAEEKIETKVETKAEPPPTKDGKKAKKDAKPKLVYSDNETSPEEKMAKLSRYAFSPVAAA